jgi:hypothetical protein
MGEPRCLFVIERKVENDQVHEYRLVGETLERIASE